MNPEQIVYGTRTRCYPTCWGGQENYKGFDIGLERGAPPEADANLS